MTSEAGSAAAASGTGARPSPTGAITVAPASAAADRKPAMDLEHDGAKQAARSVRVAVCVITFGRPGTLARVLERIGGLRLPLGTEVEIIVVDNPEQPVGNLVDQVASKLSLPVHYFQEPRQGVSFARNTAIAEARQFDFVAFIDDDEMPHEDWLAALLRTQRATRAAAVTGPVEPVFERPAPPWLVEVFGLCYARPTPGHPLTTATAGNLLLDRRTMEAFGLSFAEEFSRLGGEDTQLASDLVAAGLSDCLGG